MSLNCFLQGGGGGGGVFQASWFAIPVSLPSRAFCRSRFVFPSEEISSDEGKGGVDCCAAIAA